ncbi:MAG TPA: hypothetical protein VNN17_05870 [Terriglobia bacterium]|nr:hypothetical protein [Terriglobia bacterium]
MDRFGCSSSSRARWLAGRWLAAWLMIAGAVGSAAAQETASQTVPRVGLAELTGTPGSSLMMPFYFTPDPKMPLRSVTAEIEYVSNNLSFQKSSLGLAAEQVNAKIETSVTEGSPDDKGLKRSKLRVTATLPDPAPPEGLPEGLLAYLLFQVSLDAKPFIIRLVPTVVAAEAVGNAPVAVAAIGTETGLVRVEALDVMPEATCFFFSH